MPDPRIITFADYARVQQANTQDWIVPGYISNPSTIMLAGEPKGGKSFLTVQLAQAVATGKPFLGQPCRARRVFYFIVDEAPPVWRARIKGLQASGFDLTSPNLLIAHPDDQIKPFDIRRIDHAAWLKKSLELAAPELVIVDVLREIHTTDENDSSAAKLVFDALNRTVGPRAMFIVHHVNKVSPDQSGTTPAWQRVRGSGYVSGKVDALWLLAGSALSIKGRLGPDEVWTGTRQPNGTWTMARRVSHAGVSRSVPPGGTTAGKPLAPSPLAGPPPEQPGPPEPPPGSPPAEPPAPPASAAPRFRP